MKYFTAFLLFLLFSLSSFAQGTIVSLSVVPENPTVDDIVEIHAELMFTSSDCMVDNQAHSVNGFNIGASAHHCVGMLTAICNTTDVFQVGQLPVGTYTFNMTLSSGFGGAGCTAGIVPDDNSQFTFTVSGSVGIDEPVANANLIYPIPTENILNFRQPLKESCVLTNATGQRVMGISKGASHADISALVSGVYVLRSTNTRIKVIKL
jgi:hypothetical protein